MDCEKFDRVVLDLLYEELDELTAAAARRHLEHCARCRGIVQGLRATREVAVLSTLSPPDDLEARILAAERRATAGLPLGKRLGRAVSILAGYAMRPQLAMAALLLLMIGSSLVLLRVRPGQRDAVQVTERGVPESESPPAPAVAAQARAEPAADERKRAPTDTAETPGRASGAAKADDSDKPSAGGEYDEALAAYRAQRWDEAQKRFDAIARGGGDSAPQAALLAAQAARAGGGCPAGAPKLEAVSTRYATSGVAHEAAWQAASCYRSLGRMDDARRNYRTLVGVSGYGDRAALALAELDTRGHGPGVGAASRMAKPAAKAAAPAAAAAEEPRAAPPPKATVDSY